MQGDILFYRSTGTLLNRLIAWWTHSSYVHCGVDIGDGTTIEAVLNGVWKRRIGQREPSVNWSYTHHCTNCDPKDLFNAVAWLHTMVGKHYGVTDIINAAFMKVFTSFYLVTPLHYDCSALCTQFLIEAGGIDLGDLGTDPHKVTPGLLAKQLGVAP